MKKKFCCIGATNLDLCGSAHYPLIEGDSTLGHITNTVGGVGHNIATNLSRLTDECLFITTLGSDSFSHLIEHELDNNKNLSVIKNKVDHASGLYLYIENEKGEMIHAINEMGINDLLTPKALSQYESIILSSEYVVLDTNIPQESIEYICSLNVKVITDPVSCKKSEKLKNVYDKLYILKPNAIELNAMTGVTINDEKDIVRASHLLIDKGVNHIITTRGAKGAVYVDKDTTLFVESPKLEHIVNTTGAGDSFTAGVCYSLLHNLSPLDIIKHAIGCSLLTLQSPHPISDKLDPNNLEEVINESIFRYRT